MIVNKLNKAFQTRSDKPNSNWLNDDNYIVIPDGSELANKMMKLFPRFDFVLDEKGELIDVVGIPKTEEEMNKEKEDKIKQELTELDNTINRATEDLYTLTNTTPYQKTAEVIQRKEELRQELKELGVEENGEGTEPTGSKWSN